MNLVIQLDKKLLYDIYSDMNKFRNLSHNEIFNFCLQERLKASLNKYNIELDAIRNYLDAKWPFQILNTIRRMQKVEDKGAIEAYYITKTDDDVDPSLEDNM